MIVHEKNKDFKCDLCDSIPYTLNGTLILFMKKKKIQKFARKALIKRMIWKNTFYVTITKRRNTFVKFVTIDFLRNRI